jgi:hypothetical protein
MRYMRVEPGNGLKPYDGARPFRAVVVVEEAVSPEWRAAASKWLVDSDCLYMMAWGQECSLWDDSVDLANIAAFNFGEIPERHFVMTTWHEHEPLEEVFWFAKNLAFTAGSRVEIADTVILHVSRVDREEEYATLYAAA